MTSVSEANLNNTRKMQRSMWETGEKQAISGEKGIKKQPFFCEYRVNKH